MKNKNYSLYEILEVSPRARPSVIQAAYKTLMKEYHPDKKGDEDLAKSINEAKRILLSPKKKEKYDYERNNLEGKIIGNYRIIEQLAEGGFGKTYKGEHMIAEEPVCIKHGHYVSPQDELILIEEAKAIWDLRHFSIPTMRDILKLEDGSPAIVMSYVPGPTIEQLVTKVGKLDPEHVAWISERALNALKYLHYHGVVHGDVKPQNIIIQPKDHTVVLVDYGLSLIRPKDESYCKGYTPYFASPEQQAGDVLIPESDFYGLGITMIYAVGGDVQRKKVPNYVPDPLCEFIRRLIVRDVLSRPNWHKEDLCETIRKVRKESFGRISSGFKPIPGL